MVSLVLAACWAVGCDGGPGSPEELQAQGAERVHAVFNAAGRGECEPLKAMVPTVVNDNACEVFTRKWAEQGLRLVEIVGTKIDGRDPHTVIVEARVMQEGKEKTLRIPATWHEDTGGWTVEL